MQFNYIYVGSLVFASLLGKGFSLATNSATIFINNSFGAARKTWEVRVLHMEVPQRWLALAKLQFWLLGRPSLTSLLCKIILLMGISETPTVMILSSNRSLLDSVIPITLLFTISCHLYLSLFSVNV